MLKSTHTPAHTRPAPAQPFDAALSLKLDRLIISLDTVPPWNRRAWLRFKKRLAEQRVPAYGKAGRK